MNGSSAIMLLIYALLTISLSLPYLVFRIFFALSKPFVVSGNPSANARTLGSNSSFKYENFVTFEMSVAFSLAIKFY